MSRKNKDPLLILKIKKTAKIFLNLIIYCARHVSPALFRRYAGLKITLRCERGSEGGAKFKSGRSKAIQSQRERKEKEKAKKTIKTIKRKSYHGKRRDKTCSFCTHKSGHRRLIQRASRIRKRRLLREEYKTLKRERATSGGQSQACKWRVIALPGIRDDLGGHLDAWDNHFGTCSRMRSSRRRSVLPTYLHPQVHTKE